MKKSYFFTLLSLFLLAFSGFGQTTLSAGDLVVIQFQADTPDTFRFVPLVDLEQGTVIKFSEGGYSDNSSQINTNESIIVYTAPTAISAGTNIKFEADDITNNSSVWAFEVGTFVGFSTSGDQLLVYQGDTATPTFIFAVASNSTEWQTNYDTDSNQTALPPGLTNGVNAVAAGAGSGAESEYDNIYYNGITSGSKSAILASVASVANWVGNNGTSYDPVPISTDFVISVSSEPNVTITAPSSNQVFSSTTTEVSVNLSIDNFTVSGDNGSGMSDNTGDGYLKTTLQETGQSDVIANFFTSTPDPINVVAGRSYTATVELVDNSGNSLSPKVEASVSFSVEFPCDIQLSTITEVCDAETSGTDTYTTTIEFSGGNTGATYTITAKDSGDNDVGTIGGDNPDSVASGSITITNVPEGTDFTVKVIGGATSSCDLTRSISSPTCVTLNCPVAGSVIITEIMQNPAVVGDSNGEYFEVYNTTGSDIDLIGWILKDTSSSSETHTIGSSLVVPANGYAVLGVNTDMASNGGVTVNYDYGSSYYLGNSSDDIVLECGGSTIDIVEWDNGATFPDPSGKSMELSTNKYNATDNDSGTNWGEATTEITSGGDLGTPGAVNGFTLTLSVVRNSIEGFALYPNPVRDGKLNIRSNSTDIKQVSIFNVLGKNVLNTTITGTNSEINVATISSGIYILKVVEGTKTATSKLVIR